MHIDIPPLPYGKGALEPHISEENLTLHYDRQVGYINQLNAIPYVKSLQETPLEQIVLDSIESQNEHLFNIASQAWSHSFFWHSLQEDGGGVAIGKIALRIRQDFGDYAKFRERFIEESKTLFGSGWIYLVFNPKISQLQFFVGKDAEPPFPFKLIPIFVIDLWEHAFQCDYDNDRTEYVESMLDNCINWEFANDNCRRAGL